MRSVVLVDDEYWALCGFEVMFPWQKFGYRIIGKYEDAFTAIEAICEQKPDLVLTDIRMPGMTGLELIKQSRERGVRNTVFVIISSYSEFDYARTALKEGAFDYLLKPITPVDAESFLSRLNAYLDEKMNVPNTNENVPTNNAQFNSLLEYVSEHFCEPLQLKNLASRFYINVSYCSELFSDKLGMSFSKYLNKLRIEKSCALLRTTAMPIADIGMECGFSENANFTRVFKQMMDETPTQYRVRVGVK